MHLRLVIVLLAIITLCLALAELTNAEECGYSRSTTDVVKALQNLDIAPEDRCTPYDKKKQYPYPQSVEDVIVENMGGLVYGPYTGTYFADDTETDIEHIVAASEAHDSGLCSASASKRVQFATDQLNLTLASPQVNRCSATGKCGKDIYEWQPEKNKCWYANRVIEIKTKYDLTVDLDEWFALYQELKNCDSYEMIFYSKSK